MLVAMTHFMQTITGITVLIQNAIQMLLIASEWRFLHVLSKIHVCRHSTTFASGRVQCSLL